MNKVVTINLNGNAYTVEEEGYKSLTHYLDQATLRLKDNPDKDEIISDLEQAIADKCEKRISDKKNVITTSELQEILEEMGPVHDTTEESHEDKTTDEEPAPKKLYNISDGAIIAGVCNGLAAYFNIDVKLVRIAFIILGFATHGFAVAVYLALMFLVPYAKTGEEVASARGERYSAEDIIDQAKSRYKANKDTMKATLKENMNTSPAFAIIHRIMNGVFAFILSIIGVALTWAWIISLFAIFQTGSLFGYTLGNNVTNWVSALFITSAYYLVFWPLASFLSSGFEDGKKTSNRSLRGQFGWTIWGIFVVSFIVLAASYSTQLNKNITKLQNDLQSNRQVQVWESKHFNAKDR